jgi:hypothetical protein
MDNRIMLISLLVHLVIEEAALVGLWLAGEWILSRPTNEAGGLVFIVIVVLAFLGFIMPAMLPCMHIRLSQIKRTLIISFAAYALQAIVCVAIVVGYAFANKMAFLANKMAFLEIIALEEILTNICGLVSIAYVWNRTKKILSKHPDMWKLSNSNANHMALICYIIDKLREHSSSVQIDLVRVEERITNMADEHTYDTRQIRIASGDKYFVAWTTSKLGLERIARDDGGLFQWRGGVKVYLTDISGKEGLEKFVHDLSDAPLSPDLVMRFNMWALLSIGRENLSAEEARRAWA